MTKPDETNEDPLEGAIRILMRQGMTREEAEAAVRATVEASQVEKMPKGWKP